MGGLSIFTETLLQGCAGLVATGRWAPSEASILIPLRMLLAMVSVLYFLKIVTFPCLKKLPILK